MWKGWWDKFEVILLYLKDEQVWKVDCVPVRGMRGSKGLIDVCGWGKVGGGKTFIHSAACMTYTSLITSVAHLRHSRELSSLEYERHEPGLVAW